MAKPKFAIIIPVYEKFWYARRAIESCLKYTENCVVILEDDASPNWDDKLWPAWKHARKDTQVIIHRYPKNGGLTRSWNHGLRVARDLGAEYCVAGNSDILFCEGWHIGLERALNNGYHLVGPISNAPGPTAGSKAAVDKYVKRYRLDDTPDYLNGLSKDLRTRFPEKVVNGPVNGFFQMAKISVWWDRPFDSQNPFSTHKHHRMVHNEDELQKRWRRMKRKFGIVPSSFIFHYRAVTRGGSHKKGKWYRLIDPERDV